MVIYGFFASYHPNEFSAACFDGSSVSRFDRQLFKSQDQCSYQVHIPSHSFFLMNPVRTDLRIVQRLTSALDHFCFCP